MPKVWEEKHKLVLPTSHGRSVGLHVSEVIRDLAFNGNILDKKWARTEAIEFQDTSLMQVGMAWEDYMEKSGQHEEIEYHPCELAVKTKICAVCGDWADEHFEHDHEHKTLTIFMSPDGFTFDADNVLLAYLNEIKFTKKSCRDFGTGLRMGSKKSIMYVWQIAAYLKGTGTLAAKLHVLFVNGNYSYDDTDPENGTVYKIFRIEFTEEEIDSNWRMLESHAREMVKSGKYKHTG